MSAPVEYHWVLSYATPAGDLGYRDGTIPVRAGATRQAVLSQVVGAVSVEVGRLVVTHFSVEPNVLGGGS